MATTFKVLRLSGLLGVALLVGAPAAQAQPGRFPVNLGGAQVLPNSAALINPAFQIRPGLTLNQAAYNTMVMGRALNSIPPWVAGYNPYPSPIINQSPIY